MASKLTSLIDSAITAQQSGKLDEALQIYQSALRLEPEDAELASLFGLALTQANRLAEAEPLLLDAVAREPEQAGFRMNLSEFLIRKGLLDEANKEVMSIVKRNPGFSPGWQKLGDIAILQADKQQAKDAYKKAYSTVAANFNVGLKLAELHLTLKEFDQALSVLNNIAVQNPNHASLFHFACIAIAALQDWSQLESVALNWTRAWPNDPVAWQMLATASMEQGRHRLAEEHFRKVLANRSENAEDLSVYGQICLQCFEYERARVALDKAEILDPKRVDLLVSQSLLHTYFGEFAKAEDYCRRAIQLAPGFIPAYTQLGHLTRGQFTDMEMEYLEGLKNDTEQAMEHRIDLAFTMGSAYETRAMYNMAWETYELANRLNQNLGKSLKLRYNRHESAARTQHIKSLYRPDTGQQFLHDASPCPIFIVGMPRSGTTLIESTIAAHSAVFAGGERPLLPQINNAALSYSLQNDAALPPTARLEEWAGTYLSDIPDIGTLGYFTDKNPLNIEAVGLITRLFPNAVIVHIRRNPLETCFSIFKHKFSKFWCFAHSLTDIAHFYGQYAQLVSHWQQTLGDRFLTIQYEEFTTNFSAMAPLLIQHCDLGWESQCLDFQHENRAIATLSAVQIREPVKTRMPVTGFYREFMPALIEELNAAGVDPDSGALIGD